MNSDFDFLLGKWKVTNTRLSRWLCDCKSWVAFDSTHLETRLQSGAGNFAMHSYVFNKSIFERTVLRLYDGSSDFWKINRLDTMSNLMMSPLTGTFWRNKGSFLSKGTIAGTDVLVWVEWTKICKTYASWEQALSSDNGRTWENNWVMEFFKVRSA